MNYAYIGTTTKGIAKRIMDKHNCVKVVGEWNDGMVDLGVPTSKGDRIIGMFQVAMEKGRL